MSQLSCAWQPGAGAMRSVQHGTRGAGGGKDSRECLPVSSSMLPAAGQGDGFGGCKVLMAAQLGCRRRASVYYTHAMPLLWEGEGGGCRSTRPRGHHVLPQSALRCAVRVGFMLRGSHGVCGLPPSGRPCARASRPHQPTCCRLDRSDPAASDRPPHHVLVV